MNIQWTDAARDDVLEIAQYLTQNATKTVAGQITKSILNEVASLKQWPTKGLSFFIWQALPESNWTPTTMQPLQLGLTDWHLPLDGD